ncbi:MAG: ABC transporter ATP-binding protein [Paracoccaceae bacterium]
MGSIELSGIEKWFGEAQVIKGIELNIKAGEFIIFVGPSGCGKSTLLRMIGGLEETSRGKITLNGRDVTDEPPAKRGLSMVFQSYALYPHMSVKENMGFSLKTAGKSKDEIREKVKETAKVLRLEKLLDRHPKDLSGGQRQRVAIGRSIVRAPSAFLFDEPLSNLDAALRVEMRLEIAKLHKSLKSTMIYVTHDQTEAMTLADRIVVLDDGKIIQVGTPRQLYKNPANLFVAQFIGSPKMNIINCNRLTNSFLGNITSDKHLEVIPHKFGIRPEHIKVNSKSQSVIEGKIDVIEYLGADSFLFVDCEDLGIITVRVDGSREFNLGEMLNLEFQTENTHFFDSSGAKLEF